MKKCGLSLVCTLIFIFISLSFAPNLSEKLATKIAQLQSSICFSQQLSSIEKQLERLWEAGCLIKHSKNRGFPGLSPRLLAVPSYPRYLF
ncbi:MAG: hypothetical protein H0U73_08335 [Tatlockia sp.]|nr:hypothetical protein [Tatlockia sp.]